MPFPAVGVIVAGVVAGVGYATDAVIRSKPVITYAQKRGVLKWLWSKNFILVGPAEAGKTSFINLLNHNHYADETQTIKTKEVVNRNKFVQMEVGEQKLNIGWHIDTPGEHDFDTQIENIKNNSVTGLIIWCSHENFASESKNLGANWLNGFLARLTRYFVGEVAEAPITSITIVLNKSDLVAEEDRLANEQKAHALVSERLGGTLGDNIGKIAVVSCTLIKREGGEDSVEEVLRLINNGIKSKKPLYQVA